MYMLTQLHPYTHLPAHLDSGSKPGTSNNVSFGVSVKVNKYAKKDKEIAMRSKQQDEEFLKMKPSTPLTPSRKVKHKIQVDTHIHIHKCTHVYVYEYVYVYICICICIYICMYVCMHI